MNKSLLLKEFKRNSIAFSLWLLVICLLIFFTMSFYPTFMENQSQVAGMMSIIPKEIMEMRGFSNFGELFSVLGFYSANNIIYMMLLGSIYSIVLASNILLKEEYQKTAEFLFSKPISRAEIFITKFFVFFVNVIVLNFITALVGLISIKLFTVDEFSLRAYIILSCYTLLLNLLFGSIGLFISTIIRRSRPITTFSIALVMIFYFIFTISKITESGEKLGYVSPFKYVRTDVLSDSYGIDLLHILYFLGISVLLIVLSFNFYRKKDIYV